MRDIVHGGAAGPCVSIGLPVLNGDAFLGRAIESVLTQDFPDLELILVDNASDDDTGRICREAAERDPRVRCFVQSARVGAVANFNRALDLARGEYFCWLAHDDWWGPGYLTRCVAELEAHPGSVLCSTMMGVVDDTGQVFREQRELLSGADAASARRRYHRMIWNLQDPTAPVFGVMRTSALRRAGGIPAVPEPDTQLLHHLALVGRLHAVPELLFFHYGPKGHARHYGAGPVRRRAWDWLHAPGTRRLKAATARILLHQMRVIARSDMPVLDKAASACDVVAATAIRRTRSKTTKVVRASRERAAARRRPVPEIEPGATAAGS